MGCVSSSGVSQPTESSCSHRPVNIVACDGSVHDDGRPSGIEANPPLGELGQGRAGGAVVAVEAQMAGRDRVQHDQEDIGGPRRRQGPGAARAIA